MCSTRDPSCVFRLRWGFLPRTCRVIALSRTGRHFVTLIGHPYRAGLTEYTEGHPRVASDRTSRREILQSIGYKDISSKRSSSCPLHPVMAAIRQHRTTWAKSTLPMGILFGTSVPSFWPKKRMQHAALYFLSGTVRKQIRFPFLCSENGAKKRSSLTVVWTAP